MGKEKSCRHKWIPLLGRAGKKDIPTALFTCLSCGEMKVGTNTIRISNYRMDMGGHPIYVGNVVLKNEPVSDVTASGLIVPATVDTNAQGIGAPLFMAADGHLDTANATSSATSPCVALALETGTGTKNILVHGVLRVDAWNWTIGPGNASLIYVAASAGTLTQTKPTGTDNVVQPVGWALSDDCIYFSPSMLYFTHT
jgi:hypothetical protein